MPTEAASAALRPVSPGRANTGADGAEPPLNVNRRRDIAPRLIANVSEHLQRVHPAAVRLCSIE